MIITAYKYFNWKKKKEFDNVPIGTW